VQILLFSDELQSNAGAFPLAKGDHSKFNDHQVIGISFNTVPLLGQAAGGPKT